MIIFFKDSLREKSKKELQKRFPDIWKEIDKPNYRYKTILSKNNAWVYTLTFLTLTFLISILISKINLDWLKFLSFETTQIAQTTLENRISNVATIIGVTLTVSTIMISNIAEKKKENYEAIFQETFIYPIVYYALGLLAFMIVVSVFRSVFIEMNAFHNLVILSHYLIVLLIGFIAFMFYNIIEFFNLETIRNVHNQNFINSSHLLLREEVLIANGLQMLEIEIGRISITKKADTMFSNDYTMIAPKNDSGNALYYDVKIDSLLHSLKNITVRKTESLFYRDSVWSLKGVEFIAINKVKDDKEIIDLNKYYIYKQHGQNFFGQCETNQKLILGRLRSAIENKDEDLIQSYFDTFYGLFDKYVLLTAKANIVYYRNSDLRKSFNNFFYKLLKILTDLTDEKVRKSHEYNIAVKEYKSLFLRLLDDAMKNQSDEIFENLKSYPYLSYDLGKSKHSIFITMFSFLSPISYTEDIEVIKKYKTYQIELYKQLSMMFAKTFSSYLKTGKFEDEKAKKDFENIISGFENIWNTQNYVRELMIFRANNNDLGEKFNQAFQHINHIKFYYEQLHFICKSFIYYCYLNNKISIEDTNELIKQYSLKQYSFQYSESSVSNINIITELQLTEWKGEDLHLGNWVDSLRVLGVSINGKFDWIFLGFVAESLSKLLDTTVDLNEIKNIEIASRLNDECIPIIELIVQDFEKWSTVLNCNREMFDHRVNNLKSILLQLKYGAAIKRNDELSKAPISQDILNNFKENTYNKWLKGFTLLPIFEYFNKISKLAYNPEKEYEYVFIEFILKEPFTDINKTFNSNTSDFGLWAGEYGDEQFLEQVLVDLEPKNGNQLQISITESIQEIKQNGFTPTIVFISFDLMPNFYRGEITGFKNAYEVNPINKISSKEIGLIDEIHIIPIKHDEFKKSIIVSDFENAFDLEITESPDWINNKLNVDVTELDDESVEYELINHKDYWLNGEVLEDSQVRSKILTNVRLRILFHVNYKVVNSSAFQFITITENE